MLVIVSMVLLFSQRLRLPKQKEKEKSYFNPLPQLAFFYFLLKENPQCNPAFAELFKTLHGEKKYMAAIVLSFASEETATYLSPDQIKTIREQFPKDPFNIEKAVEAWQLDVCWAEFLVRGTKAPVMKIVNAMSLASDSVTIPEFKKIGAYLYIWDGLKWYDSTVDLTKHTIIMTPDVYSDVNAFGISVAEWAYKAVNGEFIDYGLDLVDKVYAENE